MKSCRELEDQSDWWNSRMSEDEKTLEKEKIDFYKTGTGSSLTRTISPRHPIQRRENEIVHKGKRQIVHPHSAQRRKQISKRFIM
jgi:hypothetical protein